MKLVLSLLVLMMFIAMGMFEVVILMKPEAARLETMTTVCVIFSIGSLFGYLVACRIQTCLQKTCAGWLFSAAFWILSCPAFLETGPLCWIPLLIFISLVGATLTEEIHGWKSVSFARNFASAIIGLAASCSVLISRYVHPETLLSALSQALFWVGIAYLVAPGWRNVLRLVPGKLKSFS